MVAGLRLVPATEQQIRQSVLYEHPHWGKNLSEPTFVKREGTVRALGHVKHFALVRNVGSETTATDPTSADAHLAQLAEQTEGSGVLGACQLMRRRAACTSGDGVIHHLDGFCLASVFVAPHLRHRGHASALKKQVRQHVLANKGDFVTLYSEVADFYKPEWTYHMTTKWEWRGMTDAESGAFSSTAERLSLGDLPAVIDQENQHIQSTLAGMSKPAFAILMEPVLFDYFMARQTCAQEELVPSDKALDPLPVGMRLGTGSVILWHFDFQNYTLAILYLRSETEKDKAALLSAARFWAHKSGLKKGVFAQSEDPTKYAEVCSEHLIKTQLNGECIPAIQSLHPDLLPEASLWTFNEKYAWS